MLKSCNDTLFESTVALFLSEKCAPLNITEYIKKKFVHVRALAF